MLFSDAKLEMADSEHLAELRQVLSEAGVQPYLARRFRPKGGNESQLKPPAWLAGEMYVAGTGNTNLRTKLTGFFAGLHPQDAVDIGIQTTKELQDPLTYNIVGKQSRKIEYGLCEGWVDETDGTVCDLDWFLDSITRASLPPDIALLTEAIAVDPTDFPSAANPRVSRSKAEAATEDDLAELNRPVRPRKGAKRRQFKRTNGLIGQRRPDGRVILSSTPGASWGYRSGASGHEKGTFFGNYVTVAVATKSRQVTRSLKKAKFGPPIPPYIVSWNIRPAGSNPAELSINVVDKALRLCPNIEDIIVDMGISQLRQAFNHEMHKRGKHVTMDQKDNMLEAAKPALLGPSKYPAFVHGGTILHICTPKHLRVPAKGLTDQELQEFYNERERFALTVNQHLPNGDKQFESPVHRGRFAVDPTQLTGTTGKALYPVPDDISTLFPDIPEDVLYQRYVTVTAEELDDFQQPHHGTTPQVESYGRRNQAENGISVIKDKNGFTNKTCRALNDAARAISALARIVHHNLNTTRKRKQAVKEAKRARRAGNRARPKTHASTDSGTPEPSTPPENDTDDPSAAKPRTRPG
ncbi:hypothetical protein [Candidatus Poriferisodalis sp.]|uniref:hypothetical protein n=1 Tax=Candidatus Poriferisodalis sp. TaxID=3101277 RepID=UPI003C70209D